MATISVTSSPVQIDDGTGVELQITNTGTADVRVGKGTTGKRGQTVRPGGFLRFEPEGSAVWAASDSASSLTVVTSTTPVLTNLSATVAANTAAIAALPATYEPSSKGVHSALSNFGSANFLKWKKAQIDVRLGNADAKLLCLGDSTATGIGSSTAGTVPQNRSWPAQLVGLLNIYIPTTKGLATPKSSSASQTADTRWSGGTGWALNSQAGDAHLGFGGKGMYWASATASTSLTYADSTVTADTFDIYYVHLFNSGSVGAFTASATGGSTVTVDTAAATGSTGISKATVTAASAGTGNTVTITHDATTKKVYIVGIEPSLSSTKQVRVGNAGAAGSETLDWVTLPFGTGTYGGLDAIKSYAPHLTIIDLGINDAGNSRDAATFTSQLQQIITAAQVSGDVILKTMLGSNPSLTPNRVPLETAYVAAMKGLGLPVIDVFGRVGGWAAYNAAGFMTSGDGLHGNDYSYGDEAKIVLEALRQV